MTAQEHNEAFEKIIEGLNPSQREAVDTIEGPVLVIAGPGTGKTHILAARIGKILLETDAQPHNILCLTFTEAGVRSMRQRLIDFIGPEAHRVHIHTFHSFCNKVIRENLEIFGQKDLEPISELERIELLQRLIDELPPDHRLRRGRGSDIYFYIPHLTDLFAKMKSEHWSGDFICRKVDEYLEDIPLRDEFIYKRNGKGFKKGDLKQSAFDREANQMEILKSAAKLFPVFLKKMKSRRRYDYHDMILWTLEAFAENSNLLRIYQEQYLYFLADEFQDTNGAQNEILQNLISYWENPNVFIVGDDDQSIYEFQGARLKNLTDFFDRYREHLKLVVLGDNYRSSQTILDTSGSLISRNQIRITSNLQQFGIDKILTAQNNNFAKSTVFPQIREYPYRFHEAADVVNEIEKMKNAGFPLEEIAVIYAKHDRSLPLIELFNKRGIPYNTRKKINLLDLPIIAQIRTILEYLEAESTVPFSGEHQLFKILHYPFWNTDPDDLARLSLFFAKSRKEKEYFWKETIQSQKLLEQSGVKNSSKIVETGLILKSLRKSVRSLSVPHLIEKIFNKTGLLTWALTQADKAWQVQILYAFLDFVKTEAARNPRINLRRLLDLFKSMDDNRIALELQKIAQAEPGVNLLTAHGSKGLEFQYVFILDATDETWEPKGRARSFQFSLPDTITFSGAEDETEARRRLFYVAMTRAKEQLKISYSRQNNEGKEIRRAIFVDEISQDTSLEIEEKELTPEAILEAQTLLLTDTEPVKIESPNQAAISRLLTDFKLSISALNSYLNCPLSFYYENILRVPSVRREAASYGSAMHEALEKFYKKMLTSKTKRFPGTQELIKDFEQEMDYRRGFFSEKSFEQRLRSGKHHLKNFCQTHHKNLSKAVKIEYRISNTEIEGVPVTGVIDRIEFRENRKVHIVDYKTNKPKNEYLKEPTARKPEGGNYWRQLVFYKLLYENYKNTEYQVASGEISYLEPDKKGEYLNPILTFSPKDTELVKKLITETYTKITAQDFYTGCGKPRCDWCNFVRTQKMPDTFSQKTNEDLDDQ